jgi:hypothetical protein
MEWILQEWPAGDIVQLAVNQWGVSDRQAQRYLKDARNQWVQEEDLALQEKRRLKIESLRKLKRDMKPVYKDTPYGIRTMLAIDKEITKLEGLYPAHKVELTGAEGGPIKTQEVSEIDYTKLPTEVLDIILGARKPAHE